MAPFKILSVCSTLLTFIMTQATAQDFDYVSPCPQLFAYDDKMSFPGHWHGVVTLLSQTDLKGVWLSLTFDRPPLQLGNRFASVRTTDNKEFLIMNTKFELKANITLNIQFYIKYNIREPAPKLVSFRFNGRRVCPDDAVTQAPSVITDTPEEAATEAPLVIDPIGNLSAICGTVVVQPQPLPITTVTQATAKGEFPWHAALYHTRGIDSSYICGGSLISKYYVITVAHCVTKKGSQVPLNPDNMVVYLGKYYVKQFWNTGIQNRQVSDIIPHPQYNTQSYSKDIALVKLKSPAEINDYVRPVCLWQESADLATVIDKEGSVAGWGFNETGKVTEELMQARIPVVSQETCIFSYPDFFARFTSSTTLCAGFRNGPPVCDGGSGGGLVFPNPNSNPKNPRWQLRGLMSVSVALLNQSKCDPSHYIVFTDTAKYLEWIKKTMHQ